MASPNNNAEENPYLAMREAKIARNEKRLRELGLWKPPQPATGMASPRPGTKRRSQKQSPQIQGPVRRSGRLSSQPQPNYKDASLPSEAQLAAGRKPSRSPPEANLDEAPVPVPRRAQSTKTSPAAPAPNSVRSIDLDVKRLLLGKKGTASGGGILGRMMENTGKENVIYQSFSLAASTDDQKRLANTKLSFNKYCGVQEWRNCIFLWVNLGTADSPNDFLDNAKRVTWFGGSKMHDDSPVIHKLLEYGRDASKEVVEGPKQIILWCRKHRPEVKKFSPYVCFGRLSYVSHVPGSRPLSFVWELLDWEGLRHHNDDASRETFEEFTGSK